MAGSRNTCHRLKPLSLPPHHIDAAYTVGMMATNTRDTENRSMEELIDYARIDICIAAGFTESRKIAGWCETHFIDIATHNPIGPVSTAACLHLSLATPNMLVQELPRRPGESLGDVIVGGHRWEDGWLVASESPGLGLEVDWQGLARYPFKHASLPVFYREDGSLTNW